MILGVDKAVDFGGESGQGFVGAKAVKALLAISILDALHEAGLADFNIFIEIGAGNGQKFYALKERIRRVFGFLEDAPVELHPGMVPPGKELLFLHGSGHGIEFAPCWKVYSVPEKKCRWMLLRGCELRMVRAHTMCDVLDREIRGMIRIDPPGQSG